MTTLAASAFALSGCGSDSSASQAKQAAIQASGPRTGRQAPLTDTQINELKPLLQSLCHISNELKLHHIAASGNEFSTTSHDLLHTLLAEVQQRDDALGTRLDAATVAFENQAFAFQVTMADDLPLLITTTGEAIRLVAPSLASSCP
jgi:hypothetical protein